MLCPASLFNLHSLGTHASKRVRDPFVPSPPFFRGIPLRKKSAKKTASIRETHRHGAMKFRSLRIVIVQLDDWRAPV